MQLFEQPKNVIIIQQGELRIIKNGANYQIEANGFDFPEFSQVLAQRIHAHIWEFVGAQGNAMALGALLKRILEQG